MKSRPIIFLTLLLVSLTLLLPQASQAIVLHQPDPLCQIRSRISLPQKLKDYHQYFLKEDLSPKETGESQAQKPGKRFFLTIKRTDYLLRINFSGESLFDLPKIENPSLTITPPKERSLRIELSRPDFYLADLKPGRYSFQIDDRGLDYSYQFDFDLVDYRLAGQTAYLSEASNLERDFPKIKQFLEDPNYSGRILVSSNPKLLSKLGLVGIERKIPKETEDPVLKELAQYQSRVMVIEFGEDQWQSLYQTEIGSLVVVGSYPENPSSQILILSSDLTRLNSSTLAQANKPIKSFFHRQQQKKQALFWLIGAVIVVIIGLLIRRHWLIVSKKFLEIGRLFIKNRQKVSLVIGIILVLSALFLLLRPLLSKKEVGFLASLSHQMNRWFFSIGIDKVYYWVIGLGAILVGLEILLFYREIRDFLVDIGRRLKSGLILLFLILLIVELFNLIFNWWLGLNWWLLALIGLNLVWLIFLKREGLAIAINKRDLKLLNLLLVLIVLAPLFLIVKTTLPYWYPRELKRSYFFKVDNHQVVSSAGLELKTHPDYYQIKNNQLTTKPQLEFRLNPGLILKQPSRISFSIDSDSQAPIYLQPQTERKYLLDYPQEENYRPILSQADLMVWSREKINQPSEKFETIEELIAHLPANRSIEILPSTTKERGDLAESNENLVDLTSLYRKDLQPDQSLLKKIEMDLPVGNYSFFTYLNDRLNLRISKHDLNQQLGRDEAFLVVYGPDNQLIKTLKLTDDNQALGREGSRQSFYFSRKKLKPGVYNLVLYDFSGGDMIIDHLSLNSPYLVLDSEGLEGELTKAGVDLCQLQKDSRFASFRKGDYFYPFRLKVQKPGSQSDILIYYSADSLGQEIVDPSGKLNFILTSEPGQAVSLRELKVEYWYE